MFFARLYRRDASVKIKLRMKKQLTKHTNILTGRDVMRFVQNDCSPVSSDLLVYFVEQKKGY